MVFALLVLHPHKGTLVHRGLVSLLCHPVWEEGRCSCVLRGWVQLHHRSWAAQGLALNRETSEEVEILGQLWGSGGKFGTSLNRVIGAILGSGGWKS